MPSGFGACAGAGVGAFASPRGLVRPAQTSAHTRTRSHTCTCQRTEYFATCARGVGELLADELRAPRVGVHVTTVANSGVGFTADLRGAYRACIWSRLAMRVLRLVTRTDCEDGKFYDAAYDAVAATAADTDWPALLADGRTFAVDSRGAHAAAVRDAICDIVRAKTGNRPPPPPRGGGAGGTGGGMLDVPIVATGHNGEIGLYEDMAGTSLHKRGYRVGGRIHKAALNETVAAAMLIVAGYQPEMRLLDPMCGSGTILAEAALMARDIAPGLVRTEPYALENAARFCSKTFDEVCEEAVRVAQKSPKRKARISITGADIHGGAVGMALDALHYVRAPRNHVDVLHRDVRELSLRDKPDIVVCNPPWGMRLEAGYAWEDLGLFLKDEAPGAKAVLLSGDRENTRLLRMKATRKHPVRIGDTDCRIVEYDIREKDAAQSSTPAHKKSPQPLGAL